MLGRLRPNCWPTSPLEPQAEWRYAPVDLRARPCTLAAPWRAGLALSVGVQRVSTALPTSLGPARQCRGRARCERCCLASARNWKSIDVIRFSAASHLRNGCRQWREDGDANDDFSRRAQEPSLQRLTQRDTCELASKREQKTTLQCETSSSVIFHSSARSI